MTNKINICKKLIEDRICIPYGVSSKTATNMINSNYLINDYEKFNPTTTTSTQSIEHDSFRIINIYGKYLCDIYVNNSQFCEHGLNSKFKNIKSTEIMFKGQSNSIDLKKNVPHYIHNTSYESLWTFEKHSNDNTYKILNSYTGKYLTKKNLNSQEDDNIIPYVYLEHAESKYFKQQLIDSLKKQSIISYTNEDLYYIYYKNENDTKVYLCYEDVLINNQYINSAKCGFGNDKTPFIIKKATRNLDQITDEILELPEKITDICYNKTKICDTSQLTIPLFENNNLQCLNISYLFKEKTKGKFNQYDIFNLINKNNDNFLSVPHQGEYELSFYFPKIKLEEIKFKFSGLFKPIKNGKIILFNKNKETKEIKDFTVKNSQISEVKTVTSTDIAKFVNTDENGVGITFKINCEQGFTLNYIEVLGKAGGKASFKTERKIINNTTNKFKPINITKSLITNKQNIEQNCIKIKYINPKTQSQNLDENKNIIHYDNTNKFNLKDILTTNNNYGFILIFNPLLNAYMFYIDKNRYITIENTTYFKLIKNEDTIINNSHSYYIQSLYDQNLYVGINSSNKLIFTSTQQQFQLINFVPRNKNNYDIININNSFFNNILYNLDDRIIYIEVFTEPSMSAKQYYYINNSGGSINFNSDGNEKSPLLLKKEGINKWSLQNINSNGNSYKIINLKNISNNLYTFKDVDNNTFKGYFHIYKNYNTLNVRTHEQIKKYLSFNDINKKIDNKITKYEEPLKRDKNYRNKTSILLNNDLYLHNIISLTINDKFLSYNENNELIMTTNITKNNYFIEIKFNNNLCKLWNYVTKKFVVYNIEDNKFKLSKNSTEYNDIDLLNDIDIINNTEFSVFEYIENIENRKIYKLSYYPSESSLFYLNTDGSNQEKTFTINIIKKYPGSLKNLTNIKENLGVYEDFCNMCESNNSINDNLIEGKDYSLEENSGNISLSLGKYEIQIGNMVNTDAGNYFKISSISADNNSNTIPLRDFKEKNNLKKAFNNASDDTSLILRIITVNISSKNYNIIVWTQPNVETIGRFEDSYDIPTTNYTNQPISIIYDANNNKLDQTDNTSYNFISYTNTPTEKHIKIKNLTLDLLNKYKISLFHKDNTDSQEVEFVSNTPQSKKANSRRIISTCAWGDCKDFNTLTKKDAKNYLENINSLEKTYNYTQMGGKLDLNMIHFIKNISENEEDENYHNKITSQKNEYISNSLSYYNKPYLLDILFKKNDLIEFYKIFGKKGWTYSHNSIYPKTLFKINKSDSDINDLDYYDSFRSIYPVSWLEKKFAFNKENLWKYNNWFEDNPHFRSLPNWKFELVQAIETNDSSNNKLQVKFGGNNFNKMNLYNFIKQPIIIFIIIIIGILIVKHYKLI
jgi:hypothetical protein